MKLDDFVDMANSLQEKAIARGFDIDNTSIYVRDLNNQDLNIDFYLIYSKETNKIFLKGLPE